MYDTMTVSAASPRGASAKLGAADDENVKVVVRVRPMNDTEKNQDFRNIVRVDTINGSIQVTIVTYFNTNLL